MAAFVVTASALSTLAAGAALVVLFNAAIRRDRRTLAWIVLAALGASVVSSFMFAGE